MILKNVVCTCGSTVEVLTTFKHKTDKQTGQLTMRTGWRVLCVGVNTKPRLQTTLGTVWLPEPQKGDPPNPVSWWKGVEHAVQIAIKKVHLPLGPHREVVNKFCVMLKRDALELFRHAAP